MKKYDIEVTLKGRYEDIEAETEDEAFVIASDFAMEGGDWTYIVYDTVEIEGEE